MKGYIPVALAAAATVGLMAASSAPPSMALSAKLLDAERNAREKEAVIEVAVTGLKIVDPESVKERPRDGEGHLQYQVDAGPVIATTATKLSFHDLKSGKHSIKVTLAANDHLPLGPSQVLEVTVP